MPNNEMTPQEGEAKPRTIFNAVDSLEEALHLQEVKNEDERPTLETRIQRIVENIFNKPNCFLEQNPHPREQIKILESMVFLDQTSQENSAEIILPSDILESYILKNINWEKAKKNLYGKDGLGNYYYDGGLAVEMKKFDPKRFEDEIKNSEKYEFMLEKSVKGINRSIKNKGYDWKGNLTFDVFSFLNEGSQLKELDPQRFEQGVKAGKEEWDIAAKDIERQREEQNTHPLPFCFYYQSALIIDAQEIKKRVTIDKDYWGKIRARANQEMQKLNPNIDKIWSWVEMNTIKPEGESFPYITVSPELLKKMIARLEDMVLFQGVANENVFKYARALRDKEIKVEN